MSLLLFFKPIYQITPVNGFASGEIDYLKKKKRRFKWEKLIPNFSMPMLTKVEQQAEKLQKILDERRQAAKKRAREEEEIINMLIMENEI